MMKKTYNHILVWGVIFYSICIVYFCFTPQGHSPSGRWKLQGIQHLGRLVFLLTPFNSLWKLGQVSDVGQLSWIFLQNILNIFLLFPLVFQLLYLLPNLRKTKKVLLFSFLVSLGIECTQLVLDFFLWFLIASLKLMICGPIPWVAIWLGSYINNYIKTR